VFSGVEWLGLIFGVTAALYGEITLKGGEITLFGESRSRRGLGEQDHAMLQKRLLPVRVLTDDSHECPIGAYFAKIIGKHCVVILGTAIPPICNTSDQCWSDPKNWIRIIRPTGPRVKLINIGRFDWEVECHVTCFIWENSDVLLNFFVRMSAKHFCLFAHIILPNPQSRVIERYEIVRVIDVASGRLTAIKRKRPPGINRRALSRERFP
jgi:hypothetical protein